MRGLMMDDPLLISSLHFIRKSDHRGSFDHESLRLEGGVYYLQNSRVRGVLLWNVWAQVEAARQLIA